MEERTIVKWVFELMPVSEDRPEDRFWRESAREMLIGMMTVPALQTRTDPKGPGADTAPVRAPRTQLRRGL